MAKNGFSLIQIILYSVIFLVAAGVMAGILLRVLRVNDEETASNQVNGELSYVMNTLNRLARESSAMIANSAPSDVDNDGAIGQAQNRLVLRMKDSGSKPTTDRDPIIIEVDASNKAVKITEGRPPNQKGSYLTTNRVTVDKLAFTKSIQYPGHSSIAIDFQLSYKTSAPQQMLTRAIKSSIARVSAATFDAGLFPGIGNQYDIGLSGTQWKNAYTQNAYVSNQLGIGTVNPGAKLHVQGGDIVLTGSLGVGSISPTHKIDITQTTVGADTSIRFNDYLDGTPYVIGIDDSDANKAFKINYGNVLGIPTQFTLLPTGNVGIGGAGNPQTKLEVVGTGLSGTFFAGPTVGGRGLWVDAGAQVGVGVNPFSGSLPADFIVSDLTLNAIPTIEIQSNGANATERSRLHFRQNSVGMDWYIEQVNQVGQDNTLRFTPVDAPGGAKTPFTLTMGNANQTLGPAVGILTNTPVSTLQVATGHIQFPFVTTAPVSSECDNVIEAGRVVVYANGTNDAQLWVCDTDPGSGSTPGWVVK